VLVYGVADASAQRLFPIRFDQLQGKEKIADLNFGLALISETEGFAFDLANFRIRRPIDHFLGGLGLSKLVALPWLASARCSSGVGG
jgi:hypothetical protein